MQHIKCCPLCASKTKKGGKKKNTQRVCTECAWKGKASERASYPQWIVSCHTHPDKSDFYMWMSSVSNLGMGIQYFGIEQPNGKVVGYVFAPNEHHVHRGRSIDKGQRVFITGNLKLDYGGEDGK